MTRNDDEFSELFDEVYPGVCRFLECMLGRHNMAQDIAQETFLRLYKLGAAAPPRHEARFWLYRVARNLAMNELHKRKTPQRLWKRIADMVPQKETDQATDLEQREQRKKLLRLLQTLPEDQRASLLLREQGEMRYREIAGILGVSESKVKTDIFRARCAMRTKWKAVVDPT